jgi:hypothetical protein
MFRLSDTRGNVLFESLFEMANENISILDNTSYLLSVSSNEFLGDIIVDLFINETLVKSKTILIGKKATLSFKTGYSDRIYVRSSPAL